jgi:hypothetical protein
VVAGRTRKIFSPSTPTHSAATESFEGDRPLSPAFSGTGLADVGAAESLRYGYRRRNSLWKLLIEPHGIHFEFQHQCAVVFVAAFGPDGMRIVTVSEGTWMLPN